MTLKTQYRNNILWNLIIINRKAKTSDLKQEDFMQ